MIGHVYEPADPALPYVAVILHDDLTVAASLAVATVAEGDAFIAEALGTLPKE